MGAIVAGLATFAIIIAFGWALVRFGGVPTGADTVLTRVCFFSATPALIFVTLRQADLEALFSATALVTVLVEVTVIFGVGAIFHLLGHRSVANSAIAGLGAGYVNGANLGIPVCLLVFGNAVHVATILLLQLLILTPIVFAILDYSTKRGNPSRFATLTIPLRNPFVLAVFAGVAANLLDWFPGGVFDDVVSTLARIAVPLMMLALGMSLHGAPVPRARRADLPLWSVVGVKLIGAPLLATLLGALLGLDGEELLVPVVLAALPTAQNVFLYASRYDVGKPLARDTVLLTTAGFVPVVLLATALIWGV